MSEDDCPDFFVVDMSKVLRELRSYLLNDERGYEEMVRQVIDHFCEVATPYTDIFRSDSVPYLVPQMVWGLNPRSMTEQDKAEAQLAFATLYDGIRQELLRLGSDKIVTQVGSFPYMLDHIRRDRQLVLRRLGTADRIPSSKEPFPWPL